MNGSIAKTVKLNKLLLKVQNLNYPLHRPVGQTEALCLTPLIYII